MPYRGTVISGTASLSTVLRIEEQGCADGIPFGIPVFGIPWFTNGFANSLWYYTGPMVKLGVKRTEHVLKRTELQK